MPCSATGRGDVFRAHAGHASALRACPAPAAASGYRPPVLPDTPPRRRRWRRRSTVAALVLLVLAVALLGGAGWYYAGEIHAGALAVDRTPPETVDDTVVEAVDGDRAVLRSTGRRGTTTRCAVPRPTGWCGTAARASSPGPPEPRDDGSVVRSLEVVDGRAPASGNARRPARRRLDRSPDGARRDLRGRRHPVPRRGLPGWFVPGEGPTWMVFVHGKGGSRDRRAAGARPGRRRRPALAADQLPQRRGRPADPSGEYRYGDTEWRDLEAAVEFAVRGPSAWCCSAPPWAAGIVRRSSSAPTGGRGRRRRPRRTDARPGRHGRPRAAQRELPVIGPSRRADLGASGRRPRYDLDWAPSTTSRDWLDVPALSSTARTTTLVPISITDEFAAGRARPRAGRPRRGRRARAVVERRSARLRAARVGLPRLRHGRRAAVRPARPTDRTAFGV